MQTEFDYIVIGAGIAGASIAAHLAATHSVLILEMEGSAGYHSTGRSAASYEPNYGPKPMLAFTRASADFFMNPPEGFADAAIFSKRGSLVLEPLEQQKQTKTYLSGTTNLIELGPSELIKLLPILNPSYARRGFLDNSTGDLDVDLLHSGYLKLFKARGGKLFLNALVKNISRKAEHWHVVTPFDEFRAKTIVNAAGAWGDEIAKLAGVKPIGLIPKRRSIGVIPIEGYSDFMSWPFAVDIAETWYAKPQSGKMIVSSADATPVDPHDAYADDMAIAEGIERFMNATTIEVSRLEHSWGGLRTFAPDGSPVIGFDASTEGFFWLVGQGGYGIQSCPALSRVAAAMATHNAIPKDVLEAGLELNHISPERLRK
jgi:D-arginine dehydrogenase